jgi:hypothetical protein
MINNYNLELDEVDWKPNYVLSKSSIGHIIFTFKKILNVKPKNIYETTLYDLLKPLLKQLLLEYNRVLLCSNIVERDVKYFNLIGNMPSYISINNEEHGNIKLKKPKIGMMINALKQRIIYILNREIPFLYQQNENYLIEFKKMRFQLNNFEDFVNSFENEFIDAIDQAHKVQQYYY